MNVITTPIKDLLILEPNIYKDERGFFFESYNHEKFESIIERKIQFVQDNHSKSSLGVLRGMHYQTSPYAQGKLVRCVTGEVYDVAIDLRKNSPTFKKHFGIILSATNFRQMWIPEGFAHGFMVMSETAEFLYKTTNYYHPSSERCLRWDDPDINIRWPEVNEVIISEKDKNGKFLAEINDDFS